MISFLWDPGFLYAIQREKFLFMVYATHFGSWLTVKKIFFCFRLLRVPVLTEVSEAHWNILNVSLCTAERSPSPQNLNIPLPSPTLFCWEELMLWQGCMVRKAMGREQEGWDLHWSTQLVPPAGSGEGRCSQLAMIIIISQRIHRYSIKQGPVLHKQQQIL